MIPSRGAKRINLRLDKPDNTRGWKIPQVDRSRNNDQTITHNPQCVQSPQLTRPFNESGDTPLSQPSMWQASADLGGDDHKREAVKSQLESITGRMFALLNDYEDDGLPSTNKSYIEDLSKQVNEIENTALRDNIHLMLQDYNDMCAERDELLYSLQDWFEEGHIDDMIQDIPDSGGESLSIKKSLMESKAVSERLKVVNKELHKKHTGDDNNILLQEKMELEKELLKSKKVYDSLKNNQDGSNQKGQNQEVAHSWKFAAQDIFSVLTKVRNDGLLDVQELEDQITKLVSAMNEQARYIDTVKDELERQRELVDHEDFLRRKLEDENEMLNEDLEDLRRQILGKDKKLKSTEEQLKQMKKQLATPDRRVPHGHLQRRTSTAVGTVDNLRPQLDQLMSQFSTLNEEYQKVVQERDDLLNTLAELREELDRAKNSQPGVEAPPVPLKTERPTKERSHGVGKRDLGSQKVKDLEELVELMKKDTERLESEAVEMNKVLCKTKEENLSLHQELDIAANEYGLLQRQFTKLEEKLILLERSQADKDPLVYTTSNGVGTEAPTSPRGVETRLQETVVVVDERGVQGPSAPPEEEDTTKVASLKMVAEMLQKLNTGSTSFEDMDNTSLKFISEEMNTMCSNIQAFLDYSTNLINREAVIVAEATDSLQTKLKEAEQTAANPDPPPSQLQSSSEKTNEMNEKENSYNTPSVTPGNKMAAYEDLKLQVQTIGQQAIDTLRTSEQLFSQNINKQRNQLTKVAMAMVEHKKRQSPSWKFSLSNEEGFVLNATALQKPVGVVSDNPDKRTVNPYIGLSLKQRMRHLIGGNVYGTNWHRDAHGLGSGGLLGLQVGVDPSARLPVRGAENSISASRRTEGDSIPMLIQGRQPKDRTLYEDHSSAGRAPRARTHPDFSKAAILSNMRQRHRQRHNTGYFKLGGILLQQSNFRTDEPSRADQGDSNHLPLIAKRKKGQIIADEESSSQRRPAQRVAFLQASGKKAYMDLVSHSNTTSGNQTSQQQSRENKLPRIHLGAHKHTRQRTL